MQNAAAYRPYRCYETIYFAASALAPNKIGSIAAHPNTNTNTNTNINTNPVSASASASASAGECNSVENANNESHSASAFDTIPCIPTSLRIAQKPYKRLYVATNTGDIVVFRETTNSKGRKHPQQENTNENDVVATAQQKCLPESDIASDRVESIDCVTGISVDYRLNEQMLRSVVVDNDTEFELDPSNVHDLSDSAAIPYYNVIAHIPAIHPCGINDIAINNEQTFLASAGDDKLIAFVDLHTMQPLRVFRGHSHHVMCLAFNPSSTLLISGSYDEHIRVWDVRTGTTVKAIQAHSDAISSIDVSMDGDRIVSGSFDGLARVWNISMGQCLKTLSAEKTPPVLSVRFSPNDKYVLAATQDSVIRLWDVATAKPLKTYKGHANIKHCCSSTFVTDNAQPLIVSGSEDGNAVVFDVNSRQCMQKLSHGDANSSILSVIAHPISPVLITSSMAPNNTIKLWSQQFCTPVQKNESQAMNTSIR